MDVVVESLALAEELGGEDDVESGALLANPLDESHRNCRLDDDRRLGGEFLYQVEDSVDARGVEIILVRVIVRRGGDDDEVRTPVRVLRISGGTQVQVVVSQVLRDQGIDDRRLSVVDHRDAFGVDVDCNDTVVLGEQHCIGHADIAQSCDGDFHGHSQVAVCDGVNAGRRTWTTIILDVCVVVFGGCPSRNALTP